jgi:hypothetical protein
MQLVGSRRSRAGMFGRAFGGSEEDAPVGQWRGG